MSEPSSREAGFVHRLARCFCFVVTLGAASPPTASACPDCAVGRIARSLVWEQAFGPNLLAALAPFVVIIGVSIWAERIFANPRSS